MIPIILVSTEICPHVIGLTVIEFCADGNCFHWFSFCFVILCFFSVNTTSRLKCFGWVCCVDCCEILDKHLAVRALVIFAIEVLLDRNIFFSSPNTFWTCGILSELHWENIQHGHIQEASFYITATKRD